MYTLYYEDQVFEFETEEELEEKAQEIVDFINSTPRKSAQIDFEPEFELDEDIVFTQDTRKLQ